MDQVIGGGNCEEFEGKTDAGASLREEERRYDVIDGGGGGLGS